MSGNRRRSGRVIGAALGLCALAATASAWTYPLLPHVQGLAFFPERPNDSEPTSFVLSATYMSSCWQLQRMTLFDAEHVTVRLAYQAPCADSGAGGWTGGFGLGFLTVGTHHLTVQAVVDSAGDSTFEEITVPFDVIAAGGPPPPPPPPPPPGPPPIDSVTTLVLGADVRPPAPLMGDRVSVRVTGRYPFNCGFIASAGTEGADLAMTLAQADTCADSTRTWEQSFDLGTVDTAGTYTRLLHIHVPSIHLDRVYGFGYRVIDPNAPPPPPIDSLQAGLSASAPNPFHGKTSFGVSIAEPMPVDVAVFDLGGRRVATIHHGVLPAGTTTLEWNGRRADGSRAPGGIYFYRLTLPNRVVTRRLVLLGTP